MLPANQISQGGAEVHAICAARVALVPYSRSSPAILPFGIRITLTAAPPFSFFLHPTSNTSNGFFALTSFRLRSPLSLTNNNKTTRSLNSISTSYFLNLSISAASKQITTFLHTNQNELLIRSRCLERWLRRHGWFGQRALRRPGSRAGHRSFTTSCRGDCLQHHQRGPHQLCTHR